LKLGKALGEAALASLGIVSMGSLMFDVIPAPFNTLVFGGGTGLLAASVAVTQRKRSEPVGDVGVLPGVPAKNNAKAPASPKKAIDKQRLLKKYDKAFAQMLSRHGTIPRSETVERMKPILYELSPDIKAWSGDTRIRMYLLMQELAKDLNDPATARASLGLLHMILTRGGSSALETARPIFREKILSMYQDPKYEDERFLPRLMLMMDDYDPNRVESLTRDAIHVWGEERFKAASGFLGFEELQERGLRSRMKGLLGGEIARAGTEFDRTALNRAVELYHEVA
jgi:hypothetical protein